MPWIEMLMDDVATLRHHVVQMHSFPSPHEDFDFYWQLAKTSPTKWKRLVESYFTYHDDGSHKPSSASLADPSQANFQCQHCDRSSQTEQQRASHLWFKHRVKNPIRSYIGDISVCPTCKSDFRTRARLIRHLVTNKSKSKNKKKPSVLPARFS